MVIFRTLRYRNYRLFFIGNGISLLGNWMQQLALSWLVYRLTSSSSLLGVLAFAGLFPGFLLTPFAGVLSDRWDRRHILIIIQFFSCLQAFILAFLTLTKTIAVWQIIVLSVFMGILGAFDLPARQSLVVDLVEKREDLGSAIALNSALFNGTRLVGPSIAGFLIGFFGEGICFLLNALSYIPVLVSLRMINLPYPQKGMPKTSMLQELKAGVSFAFGFPQVRVIILLLALISLVGMPYAVLLPVFARDILHGGPHILGFFNAASGIGAMTAALFLAARRTTTGMERSIPFAVGIFGVGLVFFSLSRYFFLSFFALIVVGFTMMVQLALSNTFIQTVVADNLRGRVMSIFSMSFMGAAPVGSLLAGVLADLIGAPLTLLGGGLLSSLGALIFSQKLKGGSHGGRAKEAHLKDD